VHQIILSRVMAPVQGVASPFERKVDPSLRSG
jgi:hypothetical protein